MKLTKSQKELLAKKYFPVIKKKVISAIKNIDSEWWYEYTADLTIDDAKENAKLIGVFDKADDRWYGFSTEEAFDKFCDEMDSIFDSAIKSILKSIKRSLRG